MENIGTDVIGVQVDSVSLVPVKFSESKGRIDMGGSDGFCVRSW